MIANRNLLPDSYTRYRSRIGLADSRGDFLCSRDDVELVFPFKDCVLEGGQDKKEQKRDEVFYNETLAPDQVDRLLEPKVLGGHALPRGPGGTGGRHHRGGQPAHQGE